jgi:hypothetical protein
VAEASIERQRNNGDQVVAFVKTRDFCPGIFAEPARILRGKRWGSPNRDEDGITFEYLSLADEISQYAEDVAFKKRRLGRARIDRHLARWLRDAMESVEEREGEEADEAERSGEVPEMNDEAVVAEVPLRERVLKLVRDNPDDLSTPRTEIHAHGALCDGEYGDEELWVAAQALDLPRWVKLESYCEGGLGAGYDQPALVLEAGRTFEQLADWLVRRAQRVQDVPVRRPPSPRPARA